MVRGHERVSASPGALICRDVCIEGGSITFGPGTVVQPRCVFRCEKENGSIIVGSDCIFEEHCLVVNHTEGVLKIGALNLFEVGCKVHSEKIGDGNCVRMRAVLKEGSRLGNNIVVSARTSVDVGKCVGDDNVVTDNAVIVSDRALSVRAHRSQMVDYLAALRDPHSRTALMNFHAIL